MKKDVFAILKSETGENTIFKIALDERLQDVMFKEVQIEPTTDELLHADLIQIAMDKAIRVAVPFVLLGEPVGVKTEGGFVDFMTREVEIECLPEDIPEHIPVDIAALHLHQSLKISEVAAPEGVKFVTDPTTVVVVIGVPHEEEEAVKPVEEVVAGRTRRARSHQEGAGREGRGNGERRERKEGEREGVIVVDRRGPGESGPRVRGDAAQRRLPVRQAAGPAVGR